MLFKTFISATVRKYIWHSTHSTNTFVLAIILSLGLGACSSNPILDASVEGKDDPVTTTLASTGEENITDENENANENTEASNVKEHKTKAPRVPAINLYSQQQVNTPVKVPDNVLKDYQQAISLMNDKKWQQAQVLLDQVIFNQPKLSGSYVNKAIIAEQQGKLNQAHASLNKAIAVNKLNLYAHHLQGKIYRLQGEFDKAEQSYLTALEIWPDFAEAHASMGILLELYRGRLLDAHGYYSSYLEIKSDDEEVKRWKAGLEIKIKRAGLEIPIITETETETELEEISPQSEDSLSEKDQNTDEQTKLINSTQGQNDV